MDVRLDLNFGAVVELGSFLCLFTDCLFVGMFADVLPVCFGLDARAEEHLDDIYNLPTKIKKNS